jgi:hypothetical protein
MHPDDTGTSALVHLSDALIRERDRLIRAGLGDDVLVALLSAWIVELAEVVRAGARRRQ